MEFPFSAFSKNEKETATIAADFLKQLKKNDVVVLTGNLGSGKTFFVRSILSQLGFEEVSSPTFAIVNEYSTVPKIYHFDFYRIEKINELLQIGFQDYLNDDEAITFIEWGELYSELLPRKKYVVKINIKQNEEREFLIEQYE